MDPELVGICAALIRRNTNQLYVLLADVPCAAQRLTPCGLFPLEIALETRHLESLRLLLQNGADARATTGDEGRSIIGDVMMEACDENKLERLELLLQAGLDPNFRVPPDDRTLLMRAAWGTADVVRTLLKYGADVNMQDEHGSSALLYAAEFDLVPGDAESEEIIRLLVDAGANRLLRNDGDETAADIVRRQQSNAQVSERIAQMLEMR